MIYLSFIFIVDLRARDMFVVVVLSTVVVKMIIIQ